jgi:hypothetical protein
MSVYLPALRCAEQEKREGREEDGEKRRRGKKEAEAPTETFINNNTTASEF